MGACLGSGCEEIPHVQGQRSPSKMLGTGAAAEQYLSDYEEIPHMQEQRISPSKTVGGAKSCLESNTISKRDAQRAQTNLVHTRYQRPPQRLRQNCVSVSPVEVQVSSGFPQGQGLWVLQKGME